MSQARRFVRIAALALVGGLALAGCAKAQPGTAAYVGDTRYTERQVDELVNDARANVEAQRLGDIRRDVLRWLVIGDLARRVAAERSIPLSEPNYDSVAQQIRIPRDSRLVTAFGDYAAAMDGLLHGLQPVTPTEQDIRDIYDAAKVTGVIAADVTFEQAALQIQGISDLPTRVAVLKALREATDKAGVVISPRYRPFVAGVLDLPFTVATAGTTVTDLPRPQST